MGIFRRKMPSGKVIRLSRLTKRFLSGYTDGGIQTIGIFERERVLVKACWYSWGKLVINTT